MSIYESISSAKCRHCTHFMYVFQGKRRVGICSVDRVYRDINLHEDDARRPGTSRTCEKFRLGG